MVFLLISNCKNCIHINYLYTEKENLPGCGFLSQSLTENKKLHVIFPDKNCPFIDETSIQFQAREDRPLCAIPRKK